VADAAADYIRETSLSMGDRYLGDCLTHACRVAELLHAEGRSPWIGRLREVIALDDAVYRGPLIPKRFAGKGFAAWTTHYVACTGRYVYDPVAGTPIDVDDYPAAVFGKPLTVEPFLDSAETERLLRTGDRQTVDVVRDHIVTRTT
jgi:hypothetical protein